MRSSKNVLSAHNLRSTKCREAVVTVFQEKGYALGQPELEGELEDYDRVTLYRTLRTFMDKGILHPVHDESGVTKYALCSSHCSEHDHQDNHVHFKCNSCKKTRCLDEVSVPSVGLPEGYKRMAANLLISGVCPDCRRPAY